MYGLINKAVKDLVCVIYGDECWEKVRAESRLDNEMFLTLKSYPDELTMRLVTATSRVTGRTSDEVLESFGEYWILFTAREGYGTVLEMAGSGFLEFLEQLNNLHTRVGLYYPDMKPPSFHCVPIGEGMLELHYQSTRTGLAPMVVGLLKGIGKRFQTRVEFKDIRKSESRDDTHVFLISYRKE